MSSFKGREQFTIDAKGRINFPARMRKGVSPESGDNFVITRGYDKCIFVYPNDEWLLVEASLRKLQTTNPKHRQFLRVMYEFATDVQIDSASRLQLTKDLIEFAEIEKDVLIFGVQDHIEIWNPKVRDEYNSGLTATFEEVAAMVSSESLKS